MSFSVTVDHDRRQVLAKAEGSITIDDIRAHLHSEREGGGLPYSELIDARGFRPAFSGAEAREIVDILRRLAEGGLQLGPTAVVVDTDVGYGMIRMLEILLEEVCAVRPFRAVEEAERWLAEMAKVTR